MIAAIERFAEAMGALWREPLSDDARWERVRALMPILLDDPVLRRHASGWENTVGDGTTTNNTKNLLLYEHAEHGWVINALVKGNGGKVVPHDHAYTWTAYGVIEGTEQIVRYAVTAGSRDSERAVVQPIGETRVGPGFVDVIGPYETHAEIALEGRTVALIVRSQRTGIAVHAAYDVESGEVRHGRGPQLVPMTLTDDI